MIKNCEGFDKTNQQPTLQFMAYTNTTVKPPKLPAEFKTQQDANHKATKTLVTT